MEYMGKSLGRIEEDEGVVVEGLCAETSNEDAQEAWIGGGAG